MNYFIYPKAFYLFLFLPIFSASFLFLFFYRKKKLESFLEKDICHRSFFLYWVKALSFLLSWGFIVFALSGPSKGVEKEGAEERKQEEIAVVLDVSASMGATDAMDGTKPRLFLAKTIANLLIQGLPEDRFSLYTFTTRVKKIVPSTDHLLFFRLLLEKEEVENQDSTGTSLAEMLTFFNGKKKIDKILLLTDGGDEGTVAIPHALAPIFVVGVGSNKGVILKGYELHGQPVTVRQNSALLKKIATETHGAYWDGDQEDLQLIVKNIRDKLEGHGDKFLQKVVEKSFFQISLFLGLFFLILFLCLPDTIQKKALLFLLIPCLIYCEDDLQKANIFFEAKEYNQAIKLYETLLEMSSNAEERAILQFNLGTAYLAKGEYEKAKFVFESIENPTFKEAYFYNLSLTNWHLAKKDPTIENFRRLIQAVQKSKNPLLCPLYEEAKLASASLYSKKNLNKTREALYEYLLDQNVYTTALLEKLNKEEKNGFLEDAIQKVKEKEDPAIVKLYLKEALNEEKKDLAQDAKAVLKSLILEVEGMIELLKVPNGERIAALLAKKEERVAFLSEEFLKKGQEEQEKTFLFRCAELPWNQVIPLFLKGKEKILSFQLIDQQKGLLFLQDALLAFDTAVHRTTMQHLSKEHLIQFLDEGKKETKTAAKENAW